MIILLALILLILAIIFIILGYKKSSLFFLIFTIILLLLSGSGLLPQLLLKDLQLYPLTGEQQWGKHNAIVLLGGGAVKAQPNNPQPFVLAYSRIYQAASVYHACKKSNVQCTLIISGGDALKTGASEAAIYQEKLANLGINSKDIILEEHSMNTYQNAEFTSKILKYGHFDKIFLVTSGIHLKRALQCFSQFGIQSIPIASDYLVAPRSIVFLGYNIALTDFVLHEYIGALRMYVYNFMSWNKVTSKNSIE